MFVTSNNFTHNLLFYFQYVALRKLNRWKASGVDGITNRLLKLCAKHIDVPLAHVFNLSLRSGRFPATWKQARVQPVFKQKGDRSSPGSYRPIALLCSVSKVFETLVKDQVLSFCLANRVLPDSQFGFLPGRSTVWQLLSVLDDWHAARERGTSVHAAFLDLAKAFDRVDHQILIKKTGFFWSKLNLCRLVQKLLDRTNDSDHGGSC